MKQTTGNTDSIMDKSEIWEKQGLDWGSHLPALIACAVAGSGPILEIGAGHFSTPCLHSICSVLNRKLVTTELEDKWRALFVDYNVGMHQVLKQTDGLLAELSKQGWDVVLIDDAADTRIDRLNMFFNSASYLLFHDCNFPNYKDALAVWLANNACNHKVYTRYGPHTMIVSKDKNIPDFTP